MTTLGEDLRFRVREAAGEPAGALVLFHGRGADENDLFPLFDMLDPDRRLIGLAPRGPLALQGFPGAHWYVLGGLGTPDPGTFLPTAELVEGWLDAIPSRFGVPLEQVLLGGFSQGAAMTYALGLHTGRPRPPALIAFSGFIPTVPGFDLQLDELDGLPVAIGHGSFDPVIGVEWGRAARSALEAAGAAVLYRESPMAHSIDPGFVTEVAAWLERETGARGPRQGS